METNESQNSDNRIELTDLALSEDQQGEVKGGPGVITYTYTVTNTSSADSPRMGGTSTSGPGVYKTVDGGQTWTR